MGRFLFIVIFFVLLACNNADNQKQDYKKRTKKTAIPNIEYNLIQTHPHDITSFTQGLVFYKNQLFESTGSPENLSFTKSIFGTVDLRTGEIAELGGLDKNKYFGEGIAFLNNKLYQLTYRSQICFIYDTKTYTEIARFKYKNKEGWGLTTDGEFLIMSDGTNVLTYIDPDGFDVIKELSVIQNGYAVDYMNELEFIDGFIYANVWTKNYIIKIDPSTAMVVGILNLTNIFNEVLSITRNIDVMNGIAYDSVSDNLFITGKLWPHIYQLEFYH